MASDISEIASNCISNISEGTSEKSEFKEINLETHEWVKVNEAALREHCSPKTIYTRIEDGFYTHRKLGSSQAEVLLPKRGNFQNLQRNSEEVIPSSNVLGVGNTVGEEFQKELLTLVKQYSQLGEKVLAQVEENKQLQNELKSKDKEIQEKTSQITSLTNERAGYNTKLQRVKDTEDELLKAKRELNKVREQFEEIKAERDELQRQEKERMEQAETERQQAQAEQLKQENERLQKQLEAVEQSKKTGLLGRIFGK